jgi:hypothetical protein
MLSMKSKLDILTKLDNLLVDMRLTSEETNDDDLDYYANELEQIIIESGI